jgi:ABC-type nitrate/sulfonate/bicarbonate transport system substrate-binding protein
MAKMSLEVVASDALLKRTGVKPEDGLAQRIGALKGAIVGVSAVGGAQDRAARWIAAQGGLNPKSDLQVALVGGPPAIQAALENGRIEAFVLSPPEAEIAQAGGYGRRLIDPARDFPALGGLPNLVLVAKRDPDEKMAKRIMAALAAMTAGSRQVAADPDAAADRIGSRFFAKIPQPILRTAIRSMLDGLQGEGRFAPEGLAALARFTAGSGGAVPTGDAYWTNRFIPA